MFAPRKNHAEAQISPALGSSFDRTGAGFDFCAQSHHACGGRFCASKLAAVFRIIKLNKASGRNNPAWLEQAAIRAMLQKHNNYLAEFAQWRGLFARHAEELAALVKTFAGGENLSAEELRHIILQAPAGLSGRHAAEVFQPWTNRWAGLWSNGALQYHVWDSTRFVSWFVFLETVTVSSAPPEYRIYGQSILITDDFYADADERDLHRGTYYAVASK